jgi:hypothetical protein
MLSPSWDISKVITQAGLSGYGSLPRFGEFLESSTGWLDNPDKNGVEYLYIPPGGVG